MNLKELRKYKNETIEKYPQHKEEINDFYELCLNEIEEGGSETHEIELCINDIEELLNGE